MGLRDADRKWAVRGGGLRLGRSRTGSEPWEGHGPGREREPSGWSGRGDGDPPAGLGAEEPSPSPVLSPSRLVPAAGPAEVACLAGHRHLRPGPPERARDAGQPAGQRAASGLGTVLPCYLHGEWEPMSRGCLHTAWRFPRSEGDLGLEPSMVWVRLLLIHRWIDSPAPISTPGPP